MQCRSEELDPDTRAYLKAVRAAGGRDAPGVYVPLGNPLPVWAFLLGPVVAVAGVVAGLGSGKHPIPAALLATAGLITLKDGVGAKATLDDVAANPKAVRFLEIEGPQLVRAVGDVDLAQGYPAHYVNAGRADFAGKALKD